MGMSAADIVTIIGALSLAIVAVISALGKRIDAVKTTTEAVMQKVDGNYSDLKAEVLAAKAETVLANQRIAVLTERLITSTPASTAPPISLVVNGAKEGKGP